MHLYLALWAQVCSPAGVLNFNNIVAAAWAGLAIAAEYPSMVQVLAAAAFGIDVIFIGRAALRN